MVGDSGGRGEGEVEGNNEEKRRQGDKRGKKKEMIQRERRED